MNSLNRNITIFGALNREINLTNTGAEFKILKGSATNTINFISKGLVVAINGGAEIRLNGALARLGTNIAEGIIKKGGLIINGGRSSGIMEITGKAANNFSLGIITPLLADKANSYGNKIIVSEMQIRLNLLTICSPYVIFFPGGIGTLQELINSLIAVKNHKLFNADYPPGIFVHRDWKKFIKTMEKLKILKKSFLENIFYFSKAEDVLKHI